VTHTVVGLESMALSLAKTIVQKAAGAWIADRRTAEERKKELRVLLTPRFGYAAAEQRFLDEAASELASFSHEFRGLDAGEREAALFAVRDAFERADLTTWCAIRRVGRNGLLWRVVPWNVNGRAGRS
jgi:hypothetical protein